jgi:hypothetical protein
MLLGARGLTRQLEVQIVDPHAADRSFQWNVDVEIGLPVEGHPGSARPDDFRRER